jgi:hypothetical protein
MGHPASVHTILAALLIAALAPSAKASPEPPDTTTTSAATDLARMDAELALFADRSRRERLTLGLTTLGLAAVLVPAGVVVASRSDGESELVAGALILGGATPLIPIALLSSYPSKIENVQTDFLAREAAGRPSSEVVEETEKDWRRAAEQGHSARLYVGVAGLALGVAALTTGLIFDLARPGFGGLRETTQYSLGSAFLGAGVPISEIGIRSLFVMSQEELSWDAYERMKLGVGETSTALRPSVSLAPTPGGAYATLALTF